MAIERDEQGMKVHKNFIIRHLRHYPEDREKIIPDWEGSIEEFIVELENRPGQFFVDGTLEEKEPANG